MSIEEIGQRIGGRLEDVSLTSAAGDSENLSRRMTSKRGAVVLFWSGVCSHCTRYDDYLNAFDERHPELAFVAIASRRSETAEIIHKSIAERRLRFPILLDLDGYIADKWYTQQTPRAFLMDAKRTLLYRGAIDNYKYPDNPDYAPYLESAIQQFLAGIPVTRTETASFGCAIKSVYYTLPRGL